MSDLEQEIEEIEGEGVGEIEGAEVEQPAEPSEIETEARKYGWKPQDEFTLPPEGWLPAEKFMSLPSTESKMLRDEVRELRKQSEEREKAVLEEVEGIKRVSKTVAERAAAAERERYEAEIADIKAQQARAVETADVKAYQALEARASGLKAPEAAPAVDDTVVNDYRAKNDWAKNPLLWQEAAQAVSQGLASGLIADPQNPAAQIEFAETTMRQKYPHLFKADEVAPTQQPAKVDPGGLAIGRKKGKGGADLPAFAKQAGAELVEDGIYADLDAYAKDFFQENPS